MNSASNRKASPFQKRERASSSEIHEYLNTFVEEYRNTTRLDLPEHYGKFPFWSYPVRVVAGLTPSMVYVFITCDGDPKETQVEVYDSSKYSKLAQVMDAFKPHPEEVATILGVDSSITGMDKPADKANFSADNARADAQNLVVSHYQEIEVSGKVGPKKWSKRPLPDYIPPISFFENHVDSSALKNKIEQMLLGAQHEILISAWLDTSLLTILQKKNKEGILIRVMTKKPDSNSPQPVRTMYKELVNIALVRRNNLRHFRLIICDNKEVLISSADLTTHGLSQNFEAGIWTGSPIVIKQALDLFEHVWQHEETVDVNQELRPRVRGH